jgi:hypothetical protein
MGKSDPDVHATWTLRYPRLRTHGTAKVRACTTEEPREGTGIQSRGERVAVRIGRVAELTSA